MTSLFGLLALLQSKDSYEGSAHRFKEYYYIEYKQSHSQRQTDDRNILL